MTRAPMYRSMIGEVQGKKKGLKENVEGGEGIQIKRRRHKEKEENMACVGRGDHWCGQARKALLWHPFRCVLCL